jgi:hypothetical protein
LQEELQFLIGVGKVKCYGVGKRLYGHAGSHAIKLCRGDC